MLARRSAHSPHLLLSIGCLLATIAAPPALASAQSLGGGDTQGLTPTKYLTPLNIPAADRPLSSLFGVKVVIRGQWAFVGSLWAEGVFVFREINNTWTYVEKLVGTGPTWSPALFGSALAVSDDGRVVVVGAPSEDHAVTGDNRGAAYVFHYSSSTGRYIRVGRLTATDPSNEARFGQSAAFINDAVVLIGAPSGGPGGKGAVYAFRQAPAFIWSFLVRLVPSSATGAAFGAAISAMYDNMSKYWVMIGAPASDARRGLVEVIDFNPTTGAIASQVPLAPPDVAVGDEFGFSLAMGPIAQARAIVGAPFADVAGVENEGAAYTLKWTGSAWIFDQKLETPPYAGGGKAGDIFGISVDLHYGWAIVGSSNFGSAGTQYGAAFSFRHQESDERWYWSGVALSANGEYADNEFGISVSTDGTRVLVGARFDENDGRASNGSAHFFDMSWKVAIVRAGGGVGTVTSTPARIDCGPASGACAANFPANSSVQLRATPAPGSSFAGWSGGCYADGSVYVSTLIECTATFIPASTTTPAAPVLLGPAGRITTTTPPFSWQPSAGATWYRVWIDDSSGTRLQVWFSAAYAGCGTGVGTCSVNPQVPLRPGAGRFWVLGYNDAGSGPWSAGLHFEVAVTPPVAATVLALYPVPATPAGGTARLWAHVRSTGTAPLPAGSRAWFYVDGPGWTGDHWVGFVDVGGLASGASIWKSYDWSIPAGAVPGTYTYRVRVYSGAAISDFSAAETFTVRPNTLSAIVESVYPVNGGSVARNTGAILWAKLRNNGGTTLPAGSRVWFYVDGPGWTGGHWVGSTLVNGLAPGAVVWYSYTWTVPAAAPLGTYTYWAQVWSGPAISDFSAAQTFTVRP
jgi:hypothetical protein